MQCLAVVVRDAYPVSPEHTLVISRRHVGSFFELLRCEQIAMLLLVDQALVVLEREFAPGGYTIGINDGVAAGQTVPHVHMHLIPRRLGDVEDPSDPRRQVFGAHSLPGDRRRRHRRVSAVSCCFLTVDQCRLCGRTRHSPEHR
ncbi:MAG: HIT family protein [Candidatus Accumulibacter meliphilus]|uniref:HIT family protein n=1 Tax=Candidatus Accumulibacter meliphilus TaxID=2211374 RepID=A0A369XI42_9PROT|nr:MAG: HIT family protein [Candidatus Accumulibacter meliphilus]